MIAVNFDNFNTCLQHNYNKFIHSLYSMDISCPSCDSKECLIFYGHYKRSYYDPFDGSIQSIHIQRVYCKQCHHTHSILPTALSPYRLFTLFHLCVFANHSTRSLSERFPWFDISVIKRITTFTKIWTKIYRIVVPYDPSPQWVEDVYHSTHHLPICNRDRIFLFLPT